MTSFLLKVIALSAMLADHIGAVLEADFDTSVLRAIGRISFPIFAFLIAEGCRYTSDIRKYAARLGAFALISEIPFDFCFENQLFSLDGQNIFFTLFLAVLAIYWAKECGLTPLGLKKESFTARRLLQAFALAGIIALGNVMRTDYGSIGVAGIFFCWFFSDLYKQIIVLFCMALLLYWEFALYNQTFFFLLMGGVCVSLLCLSFYNRKRGFGMKWLFYAFYPLHLILLGIFYMFYSASLGNL